MPTSTASISNEAGHERIAASPSALAPTMTALHAPNPIGRYSSRQFRAGPRVAAKSVDQDVGVEKRFHAPHAGVARQADVAARPAMDV